MNRGERDTDEEVRLYQLGLADMVQGRESLSSLLVMDDRNDLQLAYARGWIAGERLKAGVNPLSGLDDVEEQPDLSPWDYEDDYYRD